MQFFYQTVYALLKIKHSQILDPGDLAGFISEHSRYQNSILFVDSYGTKIQFWRRYRINFKETKSDRFLMQRVTFNTDFITYFTSLLFHRCKVRTQDDFFLICINKNESPKFMYTEVTCMHFSDLFLMNNSFF